MLPARIRHQRPGPEWHAHGTTPKWLWVFDDDRLRRVLLLKQRWRHVSGVTRHDRPVWDVPGSPFGLDVMFVVLGAWLLDVVGLHRLEWPWAQDRPARRTAQRWLVRLAPDAEAWLVAIRTAAIDLVAPRPLEEILPARGIPPPGGRARRSHGPAPVVGQLQSGAWLLKEAARSLSISVRSLLVEARRRWPELNPITA